MCTLDIDNREAKVLAHDVELQHISYTKKQLAIGDYILRADTYILAVFERKTLEDYAASIKDGRADNKAKMLQLRRETGCRVFYIIEGPYNPDDERKFGRIPFGCIRASIHHLMLRDGISIIYTKDTLDTAKELVKFVKSTTTLLTGIGDAGFLAQQVMPRVNTDKDTDVDAAPVDFDLATLTQIQSKSDHEIVREMWSCFRGITVESADDYINQWSIADIIRGVIPRATISALRLSNRRIVSSVVVNSLTAIGVTIESRLLSCIPGISSKSAGELLRGRDLRTLLSSPVEIIATFTTGKLSTKLGDAKSHRLMQLFYYKKGDSAAIPEDAGHILSSNNTEQPEEFIDYEMLVAADDTPTPIISTPTHKTPLRKPRVYRKTAAPPK